MDPKYKIGEKVIFRKGFQNHTPSSPNYGGSGWSDPDLMEESGIRFITILEILPPSLNHLDFGPIYFFDKWHNGAYEIAIKSLSEIRNEKLDRILD